jgi:hypothetical protein
MSFTITTTSSPSTLAQIGQNATIIPAADAVSLTSPFRPKNTPSPTSAPSAPARAAFSSEPPPKRIRLGPQPTTATISTTNTYDQQYHTCLARQVFPHVDAHIAALPKDRVNTLAIGKQVSAGVSLPRLLSWPAIPQTLTWSSCQVVAILTGKDFCDEYYRRGDGTISQEFEAGLAHQAACHVQALARHLVQSPSLSFPIGAVVNSEQQANRDFLA